MEKVKSKQSKKKERHQPEEEDIAESVPDAPQLGDFFSDDTNVVSSYFCSEDSKNIESEILDAVNDDEECLQKEEDCEQSSEHEISESDPICVQTQFENLSLADINVDLSTTGAASLKELQESENHRELENTLGTEMQEIHSYTLAVVETNNVEADTRLESPRRFACDTKSSHDSQQKQENLSIYPSAPTETPTSEESESSISKVVTPPMTSAKIVDEKTTNVFPKEEIKTIKPSSSRMVSDVTRKDVVDEIRPFTEAQLSSLYSNRELEMNAEFVSEFVENHLRDGRQQHRLYELLVSYFRARNRLIVNALELEALKKECEEHQNNLWMVETTMVSESGECQDGNPVSASHEYKVSRFSKITLSNLTRSLASIKELVNEVYSLNSYSSEVLRLQIEHYVQSVAYSCPELLRLPHNAPVNLHLGEPPPHIAACIAELRMCIAILFTFQRRLVKDAQFVADTRDWLSRLVAVLLRVASWRDHLFLLNHVLRCPAGVGSWAAGYVQAPPPPPVSAMDMSQYSSYPSPFSSPHLDHMVAMLATILLPVREREHFLEQIQTSMRESSSHESEGDGPNGLWVLVDSDGEEDEDLTGCRYTGWATHLRENDLVSFLNQIPMDCLFRHILLVERRDDRDLYDIRRVSDHHVLRLFAFATVFVRLLRQGLRTYDSPRYRQFAKRLGRLIRHTVQYASDLWESFRTYGQLSDPAMLRRLQTEYDAFFLRATRCIFSSQRLGAWQFLAVIPYNTVSTSTLWKLFYSLHEDYQEEDALASWSDSNTDWERKLLASQLRQQFEEKLTSMPDAESFYLLTTFANMAMARSDPEDRSFVRAATLDLFQVGFLSTATQDSCSKTARVLLANITSRHPSLLSDVLCKLRDNFSQAGKLSLYLFKELPLLLWKPTEQDLSIIANWLLQCPLSSIESQLARLILSHLNWACEGPGPHGGSLALPIELHQHVASLVVEATLRFTPETVSGAGAGVITESVKQVSNLATSMVRPQSSEQAFSMWAWETITRLRLHILDQPDHIVWTAMANPAVAFANVPDMDSDEKLEMIARGVKDRQPIASFVAVLGTTWGHSVPLICTKGFNQLQILLCHYKYDAILTVLQNVIPLFLNCEDSLVNSERFVSVLISIVMADRTYMKMAKNLIAPEFPGPVLKQFGSMIESQLENYRRYSLVSPSPLIRLWLLSLSQIPDWTKEPAVSYLMDVVLRSAFFHSDARDLAFLILRQFYQQALESLAEENVAGTKHGGTISSFLSWVASGSAHAVSLMPRASSPESPWFAYFVLELEQELIEERTGLWREVLRELAVASGKANVDQALKKAAHTLKIPTLPASSLSIYRWSQQALDTPLDHPLLPLLWQKFFSLFLARVPSVSGVPDRGGVGDKFFEGMLNLSFHKKLKKRLQDATEHYRAKSIGDPTQAEEAMEDQMMDALQQEPSAEKKSWYCECSKLFRTFSLWLEEPRLHEPGLFLPALPPQYNSSKLAALLQGNMTPWLEYMDYTKVREDQQTAALEWEITHFRIEDHRVKVPVLSSPEDTTEPCEKILKRLQSYDLPVPAPPLRAVKPVMPLVTSEMLCNRGALLDGLKASFKALLEYAQIYSLRTSEHTALDCNFLELVPMLYRDVELEVVLHAACDSEPHTRRGNITNCAGPAAIRLKVCEARINEGTEHLIEQNRGEYESILARAMQPPPQKVCASSVYIEHVISLLEAEFQRHKSIRNTDTALKLHDVGVTLFYHMITLYNDESAFYPPSKQLLTTCIETLGQVFVCGDESQCMRLLGTIIQQPHLGGVLGPHFTPAVASTPTFLQMYKTVVEIVYQQPAELCFVLLSKFDVARWLVTRRPRLSERSQFIELVGKALTTAGLNPEEEKLILHEVFRRHIRQLLLHDFPEHYGEVLNLALRGSETQSLSLEVWFDILNALMSGEGENLAPPRRLRPGQNLGKVKEETRNYATEQKMLTYQELRETASLLGSHFTKERLQYGLYGLYPKYRVYVEPLTAFLGMVGHGLVVSTLQHDRGTLSNKLCEQLWPALSEMFSPWLAPYWTRNLKEPTAAWIQQLTDDRSVLLPWIATDGPHAHRVVSMFTECVRFILDTLPACSNILCFVWQFYVASFAHSAVKDYILGVIHGSLLGLPWDRFWPTMQDLEYMLKVVDQYLPDCHVFLGGVFIEIGWHSWVDHVLSTYPSAVASRTHICLLHLLVKLANEPNVRQSPKVVPLLQDSRQFAWHLVDAIAYEQVVNWFVMSCDPRVILGPDETPGADNAEKTDGISSIDCAVLDLLQVAAAYVPEVMHFHPSTLRKRQMFVRACVKLLMSCGGRYKALLTKRELAFKAAVYKMLNDAETVVLSSVPSAQHVGEVGLLLTEILVAVNQVNTPIAQLTTDCCITWLSSRDCTSVVLQAFLRVLGTTVTSPEALGAILEAALQAFFRHTLSPLPAPEWHMAVSFLQPCVPRQPPLEDTLLSNGHLLSLYALLLKRLPNCRDIREEASVLSNLVDWLTTIKPTESLEPKLPLLWGKVLVLSLRQCEYSGDRDTAVKCLRKLVQSLLLLAEDRAGGWGILGAIGLRKQSPLSVRCRLLSRALAVFIMAQLPEGDPPKVRTTPNAPGELVTVSGSPSRRGLCSLTGHLRDCQQSRARKRDTVDRGSSSEATIQLSPSTEAVKALNTLESLVNSKHYQELRGSVELAVKYVTDPTNSLHNASYVLGLLATDLYQQQYLLVLKVGLTFFS
ncbi:ectopic P granules protein 5 homolog isoform X3 [Periplaneta americana]|uniref:ectopic P granules protein 5 homolog isoform X3 n=1 Tax=Periplaneta americana TaxID=6978 RepID=UPI0037E86B1D